LRQSVEFDLSNFLSIAKKLYHLEKKSPAPLDSEGAAVERGVNAEIGPLLGLQLWGATFVAVVFSPGRELIFEVYAVAGAT